MANFSEVLESTNAKFYEVLDMTSIPKWVEFKVLHNPKQKEVYQIKKSNELTHILSNGIDITVILNDDIFDALEDNQKEIIIFEALNGIVVNDSDKISIEKKDFTTYTSILEKFGSEEIIKLNESIKSLYDKQNQEEEQQTA